MSKKEGKEPKRTFLSFFPVFIGVICWLLHLLNYQLAVPELVRPGGGDRDTLLGVLLGHTAWSLVGGLLCA